MQLLSSLGSRNQREVCELMIVPLCFIQIAGPKTFNTMIVPSSQRVPVSLPTAPPVHTECGTHTVGARVPTFDGTLIVCFTEEKVNAWTLDGDCLF